MNPVEIEEAVSKLAGEPFDAAEFPFAFLEAFGNKETTLKRLRSGSTNQSDLGGVLQRNNIHLKVCAEGEVAATLAALRDSPATARQKAKFILATDGKTFEAENLLDGETVACEYPDFHDHFGFFLPLAGITTVKQIRENAFNIKATGRLNRLYVELLRENHDWDSPARRHDLNHFFARLIFCFFAESTNIFHSAGLFTATVGQMSARDSSDTHNAFALYDAPLRNLAIVVSRMHLIWIATVCGKLETRYRYSNTIGWNTFPVPALSDQNKADLTRCAEDILLAREAHFPATIAELYDPEKMPANLRDAHDRNDETLERIYIGRRFKNDTDRLEKLFEMYTQMVGEKGEEKVKKKRAGKRG